MFTSPTVSQPIQRLGYENTVSNCFRMTHPTPPHPYVPGSPIPPIPHPPVLKYLLLRISE